MISVIFRSRLRDPDDPEYAELAPRMAELARTMPGFVSFERFTAPDGERLSLIAFETLEDVKGWREHPEHRAAQSLGRERFYSEYSIVVAEQVRAYSFDGEQRQDHTKAGGTR